MHLTHAAALTAIAVLGLAPAACSRDSKARPAPQLAPHEVAAAAATETLDRAAEEAPSAAASMQTIAGRLQYESTHRPAGALRSEDVLAALAKAGLPLADGPRQYLGKVVGADFCMGGTTADGLAVTVCEYASPAAAVAGKAKVEERFAALTPVRDIVVRDATTLTLTASSAAPLASSKRIATDAFSTL